MPITLGHLIPGVWSRRYDDPVSNKQSELYKQLKRITGVPFNSADWDVLESFNGHSVDMLTEGDKYQCICSCDQLLDNFLTIHVPTGHAFTIGSMCIKKFGNEELSKKVDSLKRNNRCPGGHVINDRRTKRGKLDQCEVEDCVCKNMCRYCVLPEHKCECRVCEMCSAKLDECLCPSRCAFCKVVDCSCVRCEVCPMARPRVKYDVQPPPRVCPCVYCPRCGLSSQFSRTVRVRPSSPQVPPPGSKVRVRQVSVLRKEELAVQVRQVRGVLRPEDELRVPSMRHVSPHHQRQGNLRLSCLPRLSQEGLRLRSKVPRVQNKFGRRGRNVEDVLSRVFHLEPAEGTEDRRSEVSRRVWQVHRQRTDVENHLFAVLLETPGTIV